MNDTPGSPEDCGQMFEDMAKVMSSIDQSQVEGPSHIWIARDAIEKITNLPWEPGVYKSDRLTVIVL